MIPLRIDGVWTAERKVHRDLRGSFREIWTAEEFGDVMPVAQVNASASGYGAVRGIHFSSQAKYVMCAAGLIFDVAVDVRAGSPTFGKWEGIYLSGREGTAVFLPPGVGHAWQAFTDEATMIYLCSRPYDPATERTVHPCDPAIGINWPVAADEIILSERDHAAPSLAEARESGLLPAYG